MDSNMVGLILGAMAFSVPILAIVLKSQVGKALAHYLETRALASTHNIENMLKSENMMLSLNERLLSVERELVALTESNQKLQRVLLEKQNQKQLPPL